MESSASMMQLGVLVEEVQHIVEEAFIEQTRRVKDMYDLLDHRMTTLLEELRQGLAEQTRRADAMQRRLEDLWQLA